MFRYVDFSVFFTAWDNMLKKGFTGQTWSKHIICMCENVNMNPTVLHN